METKIIVKQKNDATESKNYVVNIPKDEDEKTIVIKDFNNAKVGPEIDHNIKNITVQPSSKTPLDIFGVTKLMLIMLLISQQS